MASHHTSPQASIHHAQHRPPPGHVQPSGQPSYNGQPRQLSSVEYLNKLNQETWFRFGRLAQMMGCTEMALNSYDRSLHFDRYSVETLHAIAELLRTEDKYDQAVEYLESILRVDNGDGASWSHLGHCYLMMDELQKAYSAYQSALYNLQDPKEPKLWYGIGILYDRYGSLDHAEEAFSQVMRMAPNFEKANEIYFRLGIIYKQQNKFPESLGCFKWIAEDPPAPLNQTDILFQIGHVHEQQQDYESAKIAYRKVLDRDPSHAKVLQQLGWLHHQESPDYEAQEKAIEFLEKSVNSDQTDAQSWYLLGRCYMSQQKFPRAYEAYQQAVYRDGRNPTFWCSIGVLYYQINQYRDALDAYSRAIRLNPNISEVWYDLGTLYQSCNNQTSDALDAYQRAAELDPQNPHIKSRLQLLRSGHAGPPSQNGAQQHQDGNPPIYEPAAVHGPPQPQWGAPQLPQSAGPRPPQQPPPPQGPREWGQRGMEMQSAPPPPPAQPVHQYDPRDVHRAPPPPVRPHSPRMEYIKHHEPYRHTPSHSSNRQVSPSPRMGNSVPSAFRTPQAVHQAPPQPPQPMPQPQQQPPPPNRMTNPNYGGQPIPPAASIAGPIHHGTPTAYGRPVTPPANVRPINDSRPRSPAPAIYGAPPPRSQRNPYYPRPEGHTPVMPGPEAAVPGSTHSAGEMSAREREERFANSSLASKRYREWEDRDERLAAFKKSANEETRARLEDPHPPRRPPTPPMMRSTSDYTKSDREPPKMLLSGPSPPSHAPHVPSPDAIRRMDEQRRPEISYKPSEHAHHPAPPPQFYPPQEQPPHLPPINHTMPREPEERKREPTPVKAEEPRRPEEPQPSLPAPEVKDHDGDVRMRMEEPAARTMDVDENYDDDSTEEAGKVENKAVPNGVEAKPPPMLSPRGETSKSPKSGPPSATVEGQNGFVNGPPSQPAEN